MPDFTRIYDEDEQHIVRRLGMAVVTAWDDLPEEVRDRISGYALQVQDREPAVQLKQQVDAFIDKYKG